MQKEFTPYEQALDLKELGFNEQCLGYYDYSKDLKIEEIHAYSICRCSAPTFSQAFRWFREKYGLCGVVNPFGYEILDKNNIYHEWGCIIEQILDSYKESELDCLKKLIEIAKNK